MVRNLIQWAVDSPLVVVLMEAAQEVLDLGPQLAEVRHCGPGDGRRQLVEGAAQARGREGPSGLADALAQLADLAEQVGQPETQVAVVVGDEGRHQRGDADGLAVDGVRGLVPAVGVVG